MLGVHADVHYYVSSAGSTQPTASISQPSTDTSQEQHTLGKSVCNCGDYYIRVPVSLESVGVHHLHASFMYTHCNSTCTCFTTGSTQPTVSLVSTPSSFAIAEPSTATSRKEQSDSSPGMKL